MNYPKTENADLVKLDQISTYLDALFRHVDWSTGGCVSILGIGEKGTLSEGKLRERKFIPAQAFMSEGAGPEHAIADHVRRWAQYEGGSFVVPAVIKPAAVITGDVQLDKLEAFTALMVDIDSGNTTEKLAHAEAHLGQASFVVLSGGRTTEGFAKTHAYWRFMEPSDEIDRIAACRKTLAAKIGGDQAFGRATQIIRIPGSLHCKNGAQNAVELMSVNHNEYDVDDLCQAIIDMPAIPGIEALTLSGAVGIPATGLRMDFSGGAGKSMNPAIDALTHTIAEGGEGDQNRWLNFSRVAGLEIANARKGLQTLDEARELTYGWMLAKMEPPWAIERFSTEWAGVLRTDLKQHGEMPATTTFAEMAPPNMGGERIDTLDDLMSWAVHRRSTNAPPGRRVLVEGMVFCAKRHMVVAEGGAGKTFMCMDLALKLAAASEDGPQLLWMGQRVMPEANGGTVILMTGEDDMEELDIRWNAIDPGGALRAQAGDRLIALPLDNLGGAFPLVTMNPATREAMPSDRWKKLYQLIRQIVDRGGRISAVIIDTLNSTLHGEENSAMVIGEYVRAVSPICGDLKAALIVTHHVRKAGAEPIKTLEDMRDAIRGSTALPNAMRLVIGVWTAHDYERRMKAMGVKPARQTLFMGGVVKANMPEALREARTLLRNESGLLEDVSARDRIARGPNSEVRAWLSWAVKAAADQRAPFARTGQNGIYARRTQLPPIFHDMSRDGEVTKMIDEMLSNGQLILTPVENGGKGHTYLDVPECKDIRRYIDVGSTLDLKWRDHYYDHGWDYIANRFDGENS